MSNEISTQVNPATMLQAAIDKGMDVGQLGSLMALYERWQENQAKAAFNKAVAAFKQSPPEIFKSKAVVFGKTSYHHALLEDIVEKVTPALCAHGLSVRWEVKQDEQIGITCILSHVDGHSESVTMRGPSDDSGSKNKLQAIGSTTSYLQRYTLMSILGLAAKGLDDDGNITGSDSNLVTAEQVLAIEAFIEENELPDGPINTYLKSKGFEQFGDLPARQFDSFMATLRRSARTRQ